MYAPEKERNPWITTFYRFNITITVFLQLAKSMKQAAFPPGAYLNCISKSQSIFKFNLQFNVQMRKRRRENFTITHKILPHTGTDIAIGIYSSIHIRNRFFKHFRFPTWTKKGVWHPNFVNFFTTQTYVWCHYTRFIWIR